MTTQGGTEWSGVSLANEAEWSDERRGHCCIEMLNRDNAVCGFFIAVQFGCVSNIRYTAIRKPHLECRIEGILNYEC